MLHLNKVHHIALICSDYQRSLDFYTRVIGCQVIAEHWREEQQSYLTKLSLNGDYVIELFSFTSPPQRLSYPEAAGLRHLALRLMTSRPRSLNWTVWVSPTRKSGPTGRPANASSSSTTPMASPSRCTRNNFGKAVT